MAFRTAAGYGNLPQGNFVPAIFSKKALIAFRKSSVVEDITNTDYQGEIANYGDTVHIIMEPDIDVYPYSRGQGIKTQELDDDELVMVVDQANYFAFTVDDIEKKQAHINWETLASNRAAYKMKDKYDQNVLQYMYDNAGLVHTGLKLGDTSNPLEIGLSGTYDFTPLGVMNRVNRLLTELSVPTDQRWFVADPFFWELMGDENSKLMQDSTAGDEKGSLRNGLVSERPIRKFKCYESINLPSNGDGSDGTSTSYGVILAGHMSAVSTAIQITKTETLRAQNTFGDIVRGMHLFGRKLIRPESLVAIIWHKN